LHDIEETNHQDIRRRSGYRHPDE